MLTLCFTLTMPNRGSWNGRWSGENDFYGHFRSVTKATAEKLDGQSFYYRWGDGWGANVSVRLASGSGLRTLRRNSKGFCGYEWMVDSILKHGAIYASHEEMPKPTPKEFPHLKPTTTELVDVPRNWDLMP